MLNYIDRYILAAVEPENHDVEAFPGLLDRGEDGSDTGPWLSNLFDVLNTPEDRRQRALDEDLAGRGKTMRFAGSGEV